MGYFILPGEPGTVFQGRNVFIEVILKMDLQHAVIELLSEYRSLGVFFEAMEKVHFCSWLFIML